MKKILLLVVIIFVGVFTTVAQDSGKILEFSTEIYDFNIINEGTVAEHTFVFTNKANKTVTLANVQASCGCTTPSWSREPIAPGQQGKIIASYNSEGRPGFFSKTVTVVYTEEGQSSQSIILTIKGNVLGKMRPEDSNAINSIMSISKAEHNFGKIQLGQKVAKSFTFTNTGTANLTINSVTAPCQCVTMTPLKNTVIKAGETATLELVFAPTQASNKDEVVVIYTNSTIQPQVMITLRADVVQSLQGQSMLKESDGF